MQTRAAVLYETNQPFKVETVDLAPPRDGEVLVKLHATGVCHSDYHLLTGATEHPLPVVPGHEGAGVVKAVGPGVARVSPGDRVALSWAPSCGSCYHCLDGRQNLCDTFLEPIWAGTMADGTPRLSLGGQPLYHYSALACFAEYAVVPAVSCVPLPREVPLTVAALIGCAVSTGVGSVLYTAKVQPGQAVVVFGAGGVGLSTILGARLAGAGLVIAVDTGDHKLDLALSAGADDALLNDEDTNDRIRRLTRGRGADHAFDTTGVPSVQEQCLFAVRSGGTIVLSGLAPQGSATNLPGSIITRRELTVRGSYYGSVNPARDFPLLADLYLRDRLDLESLISRTYDLHQINEAFQDMLNGTLARGVVVFGA